VAALWYLCMASYLLYDVDVYGGEAVFLSILSLF